MLTIGHSSGRAACVMVHGAMRTGRVEWWQLAVVVAEDRKVVLLDLPGHGSDGSDPVATYQAGVQWLVGELRQIGEPVHLVGHSNGGNLVLGVLMAAPELVVSAVIQAANASVTPALADVIGTADTGAVPESPVARWRRIHSDWEELFQATHSVTLSGPDLGDTDLRGVGVPTLVVEGARDTTNAPLRHASVIATNIPGAVLWQPPVGHDVHVEIPSHWLWRIRSFLEDNDQTREGDQLQSTTAVEPVRARPERDSEQVTQVLPNEVVVIESQEGSWSAVRLCSDGYRGWTRLPSLVPVHQQTWAPTSRITVPVAEASDGILLPMGAEVVIEGVAGPVMSTILCRDGRVRQLPTVSMRDINHRGSTEGDLGVLLGLVGTSYQWGGRTWSGIDCSGLSQLFWSLRGVQLPRDAWEQFEATIPAIGEPEPGDLLFFSDPGTGSRDRVSHVAIHVEPGAVVHAFGPAGQVRVDDPGDLMESHRLVMVGRSRPRVP